MKFLQPSEKGRENWRRLSFEDQLSAAAWLVKAVHRNKKLKDISKDVVIASAGPREKTVKQKSRLQQKKIALKLTVNKKKKLGSASSRLIPAEVQVSIPVNGKRRVLAIPTDVIEKTRAPVAQNDASKVFIESTVNTNNVRGSLCCLVKNANGNTNLRYALTCHHVAFLSLKDRFLRPDKTALAYHELNASQQGMGIPSREAPLNKPNKPLPIDAALIALDSSSPALQSDYWPYSIEGWAENEGQIYAAFNVFGCHVYNRRLNGRAVNFVEMCFNFPVHYLGGGRAVFDTLIKYKLSGGIFKAGDSGGALVAESQLVGMHIAGSEGYGYAIPAYQLLDHYYAFSPKIVPA